ncbi:MAG: UbiA family prenyltransferase [Halodesulfurarchaeum sp.]
MNRSDLRFLFLKLNIWLCLTALLMVVATAVALSIPLSSIGYGLVLPSLLFFFIYTEERRNVSPEDWINHPRRTRQVRRYRKPLLVAELMALALYEGLLLVEIVDSTGLGLEWFVYGQLPLAVLMAYGTLKKRPMFDSIAVGCTWASAIVFSVLVSTGQPMSASAVIVFAAWFIIVFAGVESRNAQDVDGDTATDKTTLAGYLGTRKTSIVEAVLKAVGVLVFWWVSGPLAASIVVVYIVALRAFRTMTRREDERWDSNSSFSIASTGSSHHRSVE